MLHQGYEALGTGSGKLRVSWGHAYNVWVTRCLVHHCSDLIAVLEAAVGISAVYQASRRYSPVDCTAGSLLDAEQVEQVDIAGPVLSVVAAGSTAALFQSPDSEAAGSVVAQLL